MNPQSTRQDAPDADLSELMTRFSEAETALENYLVKRPQHDPGSTPALLFKRARKQAVEMQETILEALPAHVALVDEGGWILSVNKAWREFTLDNNPQGSGCGVGQNYLEVCDQATGDCADEAKAAADGIRRVLSGELGLFTLEYPCHSPDVQRWFQLTVTPLSQFSMAGAVILHSNITGRKLVEIRLHRLNRLHTVLSKVSDAIVRKSSQIELYGDVCRIVVRDGHLRLAWIAGLDETDGSVRVMAATGESLDGLRDLTVTTDDGPFGQSPLGTTLRTGVHDFCNDFSTDPRMVPWREKALRHGFRASAAFPIKRVGVTIGALVIGVGEAGYFQPDEVELLKAVAEEISFAVDSHHKEQKRLEAEQALRASEQQFASSFEHAAIGMALVSPLGNFIRVNRSLCAMLGYTVAELLQRTFQDITHPDDLDADLENVRDLLAGRFVNYQMEKRYFHIDGGTVWINLNVSLVRDDAGQPVHFVSQMQDITGEKRTAAEIRRTTDLLHAVADGTSDAVFVKDLEGRYLFANAAAAGFVNLNPPDLLGREDEEFFGADGARIIRENDGFVIRSNQAHTSEEVLTAVGVTRVYQAKKAPYRDGRGNVVGIIGISRDITEQRQLEKQFLRAQRMESIGTLAGGIAHDLNNVLAPIMMSIDLLKLRENDPARLNILTTIESSARRGAEMVRQVLSFARGVEGQRIEVDMSPLIREIAKIAGETFPKNIEVAGDVSPDLWSVLGDHTQLHQVILNLTINARDAMPEGGRLTIYAENVTLDTECVGMDPEGKPGPHVLLRVEDTGCGMPPEVVERIFEPFFTTKDLGKGTGLGLSTTSAIIKSHGGFIRVRSGIGKGTEFSIYLPALAARIPENGAVPVLELPRGNGELVLIVDDESSLRRVTRQTLEAFGYRVIEAADGAEAVAIYAKRKHEIAVVLTDMLMPVMDGPATIRELLKLNPVARIIPTSGINHNGVRNFLPKPYSAAALLTVLRTVLDGTAGAPMTIFHDDIP
ncbi:MAG: PAS domain S-box protein [Luteolibacter sp.]